MHLPKEWMTLGACPSGTWREAHDASVTWSCHAGLPLLAGELLGLCAVQQSLQRQHAGGNHLVRRVLKGCVQEDWVENVERYEWVGVGGRQRAWVPATQSHM
jgi:hypothetical protein